MLKEINSEKILEEESNRSSKKSRSTFWIGKVKVSDRDPGSLHLNEAIQILDLDRLELEIQNMDRQSIIVNSACTVSWSIPSYKIL